MSMTSNYKQTVNKAGRFILSVEGKKTPPHLNIRIPPAWTNVRIDPDPNATVIATGIDLAGRKQRLYSVDHVKNAKGSKFERVRALLTEWEDIRTQIETDLNDILTPPGIREAALVAYLIYETGIRPGSTQDTKATVQAYGATTLQLKHVKPCVRGVMLKFVGKKGVPQSILVTNPYIVRVCKHRKRENPAWSAPLFPRISLASLRAYFKNLGSGQYTPKDFRTACGTKLAIELLGSRVRIPATKSGKRKLVNGVLDKVASKLGNTRAISKSAYVDPEVLERFIPSKN